MGAVGLLLSSMHVASCYFGLAMLSAGYSDPDPAATSLLRPYNSGPLVFLGSFGVSFLSVDWQALEKQSPALMSGWPYSAISSWVLSSSWAGEEPEGRASKY